MEQLYTDFTTKLLPQIQAGLVISKEYFMDLFGRYVKYLIWYDAIWVAFWVVVLVGSVYWSKHFWAKYNKDKYEEGYAMFGAGFAALAFIAIIGIFAKAQDIVKDYYVPEIRIYEEIQSMNRK